MNCAEMSDFEINREIAVKLKMNCIFPKSSPPVVGVLSGEYYVNFDPCNSWADAGPIIEKHRIAIKPVALYVGGYRWFANVGEDDLAIKAADQNPLRAAMLVFLMIQESK